MNDKKIGLELLREPFKPNQISKLPKPYKKDSPKGNCKECGGYHGLPAVHLDYVGHAALTDRLLDADPLWTWEPIAFDEQGLPRFDKSGGLWIKLTVCGMTRLGYGHAASSSNKEIGSREKEVIGDALRNAAMRFGAALDLWHKGELHLDEDEPKKPEEPIKKQTVIIPPKEKPQNIPQAAWDANQPKPTKETLAKIKELQEKYGLNTGLLAKELYMKFKLVDIKKMTEEQGQWLISWMNERP